MTDKPIGFDDILRLAEQESAKLEHFFVGVEHLFIALTKLEGGLTSSALEALGHSPRYVRHLIREAAGHGDSVRQWSGYLVTPRAEKILKKARESGWNNDEGALLLAILEENEDDQGEGGRNLPVRLLAENDIDTAALSSKVQEWSREIRPRLPLAQVGFAEGLQDDLTQEQALVLQQMFRQYERVQVEAFFNEGFSGYSGALVMLVRPFHADGRADVPVIVKLHDRHVVILEKARYDMFVKNRLPAKTARIESDPMLPDQSRYGGLKYTFIRGSEETRPINFADYALKSSPEGAARFLRKELYDGFKTTWWGQARSYQFKIWQEYELLLPPALVVEISPTSKLPATGRVLRPDRDLIHQNMPVPGEMVSLQDFMVVKVKRDRGEHRGGLVRVAGSDSAEAKHYACRIDVMGLEADQHYRGEALRPIIGRVIDTRDGLLQRDAQKLLEPDFNILDDHLPAFPGLPARLPNPLVHYRKVLEQRTAGRLSTIHGDLHTGNILVGSNGDAYLIDFELARDGHTLFDWAVLEVSLLTDLIGPRIGPGWQDGAALIGILDDMASGRPFPSNHPQAGLLRLVAEVRSIAAELLNKPGKWSEYFAALAFCALRASAWENRTLGARRLAFLLAGLAMYAAQHMRQDLMQTIGDNSTETRSTSEGR